MGLQPVDGDISLDGKSLGTATPAGSCGRHLPRPESRELFVEMSVEDNSEWRAYIQKNGPCRVQEGRDGGVFDLFPELAERRTAWPAR